MIFISRPHAGRIYIAELSRRGGRRFVWSMMHAHPIDADVRVDAEEVPAHIRRQAYRRSFRLRHIGERPC